MSWPETCLNFKGANIPTLALCLTNPHSVFNSTCFIHPERCTHIGRDTSIYSALIGWDHNVVIYCLFAVRRLKHLNIWINEAECTTLEWLRTITLWQMTSKTSEYNKEFPFSSAPLQNGWGLSRLVIVCGPEHFYTDLLRDFSWAGPPLRR